jgi:hypothetical protein
MKAAVYSAGFETRQFGEVGEPLQLSSAEALGEL